MPKQSICVSLHSINLHFFLLVKFNRFHATVSAFLEKHKVLIPLVCARHFFTLGDVLWYRLSTRAHMHYAWITAIVRTLIPQDILQCFTLGSRSFILVTHALWNSLLADVHPVIWHLVLLKATLRAFCFGLHFKKLFLTL